jgi:hypothetical protein
MWCVCVTLAWVLTVERDFGVLPEGVINMSDPWREKQESFSVSFIHPGCFNDALQGGVCWCHGANTKLCCYDAKLFDESTKKWIVSRCTHYARKGGECTMHGGNIQECSIKKWLGFGLGYQKCTNRARNGGVCYDHYWYRKSPRTRSRLQTRNTGLLVYFTEYYYVVLFTDRVFTVHYYIHIILAFYWWKYFLQYFLEYGEALSSLQQLLPILHLYFAITQLSVATRFFRTTNLKVPV